MLANTAIKGVYFEWNPKAERIVCTIRLHERIAFFYSIPLAEQVNKGTFLRDLNVVQVQEYSLADEKLIPHTPSFCIDLGEQKARASDVAEAFVLFLCPRWRTAPGAGECTDRERGAMLRAMKMRADEECTGILRCPDYGIEVLRPLTQNADCYPFGPPH